MNHRYCQYYVLDNNYCITVIAVVLMFQYELSGSNVEYILLELYCFLRVPFDHARTLKPNVINNGNANYSLFNSNNSKRA